MGIFGIGEKKVSYTALRDTMFGKRVTSLTMSADDYINKANEKVYGKRTSKIDFGDLKLPGLLGALSDNQNPYEMFNNYDQQSINEAMWEKADTNSDNTIDEKELDAIYQQFVTANEEKLNINLDTLALASFAISPAFFASQMSDEQAQQVNQYIEEDKALDLNNDGVLDRDEFEGANINYFLTPENKSKNN